MNLVTLDNVTRQYSERVLLDQVNLLINQGDRIGLIGRNGSGKTTLLRLIAGEEQPDAGRLTVWGGVRLRYLAQTAQCDPGKTVLAHLLESAAPVMQLRRAYEEASHALQADPTQPERQERLVTLSQRMDLEGGWEAENRAKTILTQLGLTQFATPAGALSGGQQKRLMLAQALLDPADLLILDEPTNHLDADAIAWLETYLLTIPGALLMVTHDRYFLERVVNRMVELDRRELVLYTGNYTAYLEQRLARHERLAAEEEKRRRQLARELEWLRRAPKARGTKQKARRQRIEEMRRIRYDAQDERVALALAGRRLGSKVLLAHKLAKTYGAHPLFQQFDLTLAPGERLGIIGPNGAGKTTLLDILAGRVSPDAGSVVWGETVQLGYYDQVSIGLQERDDQRVLDYIQEIAPLIMTDSGERVEAAQMLEWFLFPRPQQQARLSSLSGGERRRLYLLAVLAHRPNVLFLDEPTNDLDLTTLQVLEQFLDHFSGCLLVASHDRYFLDRNVDFLITLEPGQLGTRYPTPYDSYRQKITLAQPSSTHREGAAATRPASPAHPSSPAALQGLTWKEQRELETLEASILDLEHQQQTIQDAMQAAGGDYIQLGELAQALQAVTQELDRRLERWLELSERAAV